MHAKGRLRHRFWGEYSAVIALDFGNPADAERAAKVLTDFKVHEKYPDSLVWIGNSEQLEKIKTVLGEHGADVQKIASLKYSVDYGEPFEIDVLPPADYVNGELFPKKETDADARCPVCGQFMGDWGCATVGCPGEESQ